MSSIQVLSNLQKALEKGIVLSINELIDALSTITMHVCNTMVVAS